MLHGSPTGCCCLYKAVCRTVTLKFSIHIYFINSYTKQTNEKHLEMQLLVDFIALKSSLISALFSHFWLSKPPSKRQQWKLSCVREESVASSALWTKEKCLRQFVICWRASRFPSTRYVHLGTCVMTVRDFFFRTKSIHIVLNPYSLCVSLLCTLYVYFALNKFILLSLVHILNAEILPSKFGTFVNMSTLSRNSSYSLWMFCGYVGSVLLKHYWVHRIRQFLGFKIWVCDGASRVSWIVRELRHVQTLVTLRREVIDSLSVQFFCFTLPPFPENMQTRVKTY